jgi:aminoglycoside 6'-N-acetyltransferase I
MKIINFEKEYFDEVKKLSIEVFGDDEGMVSHFLDSKNIALLAIEDGKVIGVVGAMPQCGVTGWELHPLGVLEEYRGRGAGAALVAALEEEVRKRGGVMIYLGTDDESGKTSLFGVDLYENTFEKIANIQNTGGHPFTFYQKQGYKIVGVFPDANGPGKPDIWMAKRLK